MSVSGEFRRCLGDCLEFLEAASAAGADEWMERLRAARARGEEDLSGGAEMVLDSAGPAQRIAFRTELDGVRFEALHDHLAAICRIILGR